MTVCQLLTAWIDSHIQTTSFFVNFKLPRNVYQEYNNNGNNNNNKEKGCSLFTDGRRVRNA